MKMDKYKTLHLIMRGVVLTDFSNTKFTRWGVEVPQNMVIELFNNNERDLYGHMRSGTKSPARGGYSLLRTFLITQKVQEYMYESV